MDGQLTVGLYDGVLSGDYSVIARLRMAFDVTVGGRVYAVAECVRRLFLDITTT